MTRIVTVGAAQLGPVALAESRAQVVRRMLTLMHQAHRHGCDLVVFPELALTTFFPRWYFEDQARIDRFFEREMPGPDTQPLFDAARWAWRSATTAAGPRPTAAWACKASRWC